MTAVPASAPKHLTEEADRAFGPGDSFQPHDGKTTDVNVDGAWLLTEPNENLDPSRSGPTTTTKET